MKGIEKLFQLLTEKFKDDKDISERFIPEFKDWLIKSI
jgi:hypothetical protein